MSGESTPVRTCVGCRTRAPSTELIRLRRRAGVLEIGPGPGRGAWICANDPVRCLESAMSRRSLARALRCEIGFDEVQLLRARLEAVRDGQPGG